MKYIYNIIKEYKFSLMFIYLYIIIAQLLFLVEPFILGKAIDGLLVKNYMWLGVFLVINILQNIFMYKRMVYDTKVYTKMYNDIIFRFLKHNKDAETSVKIARTDLTNYVINFLESDIHYFVMALINIVGSLVFIFYQHTLTGFVVISCILPISLIVYLFYNKIDQATRVSHTHYEQKTKTMETNDDTTIETFYKRRARVIVGMSTIQGKNWASLNIVKSIFLVLALVIFTSYNFNMTQGEAVAMYAYINQFLISLMSFPIAMEIFARMKDVVNRIKI
jgi:ABC-type bacteriocin/lantibiotic exporter with double-glycine peptidase domain